MTTLPTWQLYDGAAETYERHRPGYPQPVFDVLRMRSGASVLAGKALDVGAGTGIFSRLLIRSLPELAEILCVEPNEDMVRVGTEACRGEPKIRYMRGFAEALPAPEASAILVTAATAAHWFDRPVFFREVARVLKPGGMLVLLQNKQRYWDSPLAAEFTDLMERCIPGYRRGMHSDFNGGYSRVDFEAELRAHVLFETVTLLSVPWQQQVTPKQFRGVCYSMGHIKKAEATLGAASLSEQIDRLIGRHTRPDGYLRVERVVEITMANARNPGK